MPDRKHSKDAPRLTYGTGGELHQTATTTKERLTTNHGVPISDDQNSLKGGTRGPTLLEDFVLREKIQHFDHERIPERIVHARGSGAHGHFELTHSLAQYTRAAILTEVGVMTPPGPVNEVTSAVVNVVVLIASLKVRRT